MHKLPLEEIQEIQKLNVKFLEERKNEDCYERLLNLQELKVNYGHKGFWQELPQKFECTKNTEDILRELDLQEERLVEIVKEDILKSLKIKTSKKENIQWRAFEYFGISKIKRIDASWTKFFATIKKYNIHFEECSFVGAKISNGDQSCFFYQIESREECIDFPLFFNNCKFFNFINLPSIVFQNRIIFNQCTFFGGVNFRKSIFKGDVFFQDVICKKNMDFSCCIFEKRAFFGGNGTKFKCKVNFFDTTFLNQVNFDSAIFENEANFALGHQIDQDVKGFRGYASFNKTYFKKNINFGCNIFFAVNFKKTRFENNAIFSESSFLKNVDFSNARFLGETTFKDAKIGKEENIKSTAKFRYYVANVTN